jgi:Lrp/AsnC family leucine-responsive transcriptional regulator
MVKLSRTDGKLLFLLNQDSRMSYSRLAKLGSVSREVAEYRIKRLEKLGVISRYSTVISSARLGFRSYNLLIKLERAPASEEEKLENFFRGRKYVRYFEKCRGYYDYRVVFSVRDNRALSEVFDDLNENFSGIIREKELIIPIRPLRYRKYPFLVEVEYKHKPGKEFKSLELDMVDKDLLATVRKNSRITFKDLGKELGVSPETARYRFNRLQDCGIIKDFSIELDLQKLGYFTYSIFMKVDGYSRSMDDKIIDQFYREPHLLTAHRVVGKFDIVIDVICKDPVEFEEQLSRLKKFFKNTIRFYEVTLKLDAVHV